jgi:hypothetical protein
MVLEPLPNGMDVAAHAQRTRHRVLLVCALRNAHAYLVPVLGYLPVGVADPHFFISDTNFFPFRILDPNFYIPDPRQRIKVFYGFKALGNMIRVVHPGSELFIPDPSCSSRIPDPDPEFLPIPDPGSRGQKGSGSRTRIRNAVPDEIDSTY